MTAPSNANTSGLAPCPFCGGAPGIRQAMGETWVVCGSCSASTQSKGRESVAFDLWNRRAAPASPLPGGGDMDWQDKAEGLETDLRQAVLVAWKRGAEEWCRLNYPQWVEWLEACHSPAAPTGEPK